ncbi:O-antigen polymerase [Acinetobacter indicus]|uniref:O-antigen polymerase n=1 Tax=Acinetobacter indicus TaxID=756892 RepID=UPI00257625D0|nr:O-antigen polymerase [Acinetobacter indicus]MDM1276174.1 oligosaccharide repeat unit polymerase [Acinetobacter indicus]
MLKKHLIYIILNSCFILMSVALPWFGQGYIFLVYVLSFIFLLYQAISIFDFKTNYFWFVLSYLVLFYISPIFEFIYPKEILDGSTTAINIYNILSISSIHILSLFYFCVYQKKTIKNITISKDRFDLSFNVMALGATLGTIWLFFTVGGFSAINSTRVDLKYVQGGKTYALWLIYLFSSVFFLAGIKLYKNRKNLFFIFIFLLVLFLAEFVYFIALRNRTMILMHITSILIGYILSKKIIIEGWNSNVSENMKKMRVLPLMIIMSGLAALGIFIRFARGIYLEGDSSISISAKDMLIESIKGGDFGYANMVIRIIDYSYYSDLALNGQSYLRLFMAIIPDFIYDKKILTTDALIGQLLTGLDVMTIPPGVFGDSYLNFGFLGFFVFIVYGVMLAVIDSSKKILIGYIFFSLSFTMIYHFVRGSFVNALISLLIVYVGLLFLNNILRPRYS